MKRMHVVLLMGVLGSLIATTAFAGTPRIDRREARQHLRIAQGVCSGRLTRGEAARLRGGQRHVHRMERRARADGLVTARERVRITRMQNREHRAIYRLKHNAHGRA